MNRIAIAGSIVLAVAVVGGVATASGVGAQGTPPSAEVVGSKPSSDQEQLNSAVRRGIFKNRDELLKYLSDRRSRSVICSPALNDSYHLFQEALQEELDVLWDLDIYANKYGLSNEQHRAVRTCAAQMERYLDNFQLWKELNRAQEHAPK
jgi:hypothetical protein